MVRLGGISTLNSRMRTFSEYLEGPTGLPDASNRESGVQQQRLSERAPSNGEATVRSRVSKARENGRNDRSRLSIHTFRRVTVRWQYAGDRGVDNNQLFDVEFRDLPMGFRLYVTTNTRKYVDAGLSTADVFGTMVLGEEAYGTVKLDTMPARVIQKQPGTSGIYDPLDQAASIGWKAAHAAVRLNEANMVRIEHVASSNNMG